MIIEIAICQKALGYQVLKWKYEILIGLFTRLKILYFCSANSLDLRSLF